MRKYILLSLTLLIVLAAAVAAAFFWLDFRLMSSRTAADSQASTGSAGEPEIAPQPLLVWVVGPEGMAGKIQRELVERLEDGPYFYDVTLIDQPAPETNTPVLVVEIMIQDHLWMPLFASAALSVDIAYASDGQVDWTDPGSTINVFEGTARRTSAGLSLADRSIGLISRPGYQSYLGETVAGGVADLLAAELER